MPGTHQPLLAAEVEAAPAAAQRSQVPVTGGDWDSGRRMLEARGQTTLKRSQKIPKLLSSSTVPAQGLTFSSTE